MRYYDTNVFQHAQNPAVPCHADCKRIMDPPSVGWPIAVDLELVAAEGSPGLADFARQALALLTTNSSGYFLCVERELREATAKRLRAKKTALRKLQLSPMDIRHVMSAASVVASHIVTSDSDFWDPSRKAGSGATGVYNELREMGIEPTTPANCI